MPQVTRIPRRFNVGYLALSEASFPSPGSIESIPVDPDQLSSPAIALAGNRLHCCFIHKEKALHTIKNLETGEWQPFLGDIGQAVNAHGERFVDLAVAADGPRLHVCAITADKRLLHTIRENDREWQPHFGDVGVACNNPGARFTAVAAATVGARLHVCAITEAGQLLHTIREDERTWQNHLGEVSAANRAHGPLKDVALASTGELLYVSWLNNREIVTVVRFHYPASWDYSAVTPPLPLAPRGPLGDPEAVALTVCHGQPCLFAGGLQREVWMAHGHDWRALGIPEEIGLLPPDGATLIRTLPAVAASSGIIHCLLIHQLV